MKQHIEGACLFVTESIRNYDDSYKFNTVILCLLCTYLVLVI